VVGIETTSNGSTKDHAWNEISGRYVPVEEFYIPEIWRKQSKDNKQASEGVLESENNGRAKHYYNTALSTTINMYNRLINDLGVAKEQARVILPLSQYTEVYWTASFQAIMNFIELRNEKTSQIEIQEYAKAMLKITHDTFPKITEIWAEAHGWEMDV
jgi:thymidylate synthase (FAD)